MKCLWKTIYFLRVFLTQKKPPEGGENSQATRGLKPPKSCSFVTMNRMPLCFYWISKHKFDLWASCRRGAKRWLWKNWSRRRRFSGVKYLLWKNSNWRRIVFTSLAFEEPLCSKDISIIFFSEQQTGFWRREEPHFWGDFRREAPALKTLKPS